MKSLLFALACLAGLVSPTLAADVEAGKIKASMCAMCHGELGIATLPNAPNLAGQSSIYLEDQLRAYRSDKRHNEVMSVIAKPLTDAEIENLSAWFASIRVSAKAP